MHVHVVRAAEVGSVAVVEAASPVDSVETESVAVSLSEAASVEVDSVVAASPVTIASVVVSVPPTEVMVLVQVECVEVLLCKLKLWVAAPRVTVDNVD